MVVLLDHFCSAALLHPHVHPSPSYLFFIAFEHSSFLNAWSQTRSTSLVKVLILWEKNPIFLTKSSKKSSRCCWLIDYHRKNVRSEYSLYHEELRALIPKLTLAKSKYKQNRKYKINQKVWLHTNKAGESQQNNSSIPSLSTRLLVKLEVKTPYWNLN
jgi:hypothetical protein